MISERNEILSFSPRETDWAKLSVIFDLFPQVFALLPLISRHVHRVNMADERRYAQVKYPYFRSNIK